MLTVNQLTSMKCRKCRNIFVTNILTKSLGDPVRLFGTIFVQVYSVEEYARNLFFIFAQQLPKKQVRVSVKPSVEEIYVVIV